MDHLLAADVLIGENAALSIVPCGNAQNIFYNVCYLSSRIVDKLWQGKTEFGKVKSVRFNPFTFFRNFIQRSSRDFRFHN